MTAQVRYAPDFTPIEGTHAFIQWKGTDVCLDFDCECGTSGHIDSDFVYAIRCPKCEKIWEMPHSVSLVPCEPEVLKYRTPKEPEMDDE